MNKILQVRGLALGAGRPALCATLTGGSIQALLTQAAVAATGSAQLVEWQAGQYRDGLDEDSVTSLVKMLRATVGELPLLFTLRTAAGAQPQDPRRYAALVAAAAQSGEADFVDVELAMGTRVVRPLVETVHRAGGRVLLRCVYDEDAPDRDDVVTSLRKMQALGADLPVLETAPRFAGSALEVLCGTDEYARQHADGPFAVRLRGPQARPAACAAGQFGSALYWAEDGAEDGAPGGDAAYQPAERAANALEWLYEGLED